jgi:hypothetical protein
MRPWIAVNGIGAWLCFEKDDLAHINANGGFAA